MDQSSYLCEMNNWIDVFYGIFVVQKSECHINWKLNNNPSGTRITKKDIICSMWAERTQYIEEVESNIYTQLKQTQQHDPDLFRQLLGPRWSWVTDWRIVSQYSVIITRAITSTRLSAEIQLFCCMHNLSSPRSNWMNKLFLDINLTTDRQLPLFSMTVCQNQVSFIFSPRNCETTEPVAAKPVIKFNPPIKWLEIAPNNDKSALNPLDWTGLELLGVGTHGEAHTSPPPTILHARRRPVRI